MSGIVRLFTGGETSAQKRAKRQAEVDAAAAQKKTALLTSEADAEKARAKKKLRTAGRRRTVLTSPLGLVDTDLSQTLGG